MRALVGGLIRDGLGTRRTVCGSLLLVVLGRAAALDPFHQCSRMVLAWLCTRSLGTVRNSSTFGG